MSQLWHTDRALTPSPKPTRQNPWTAPLPAAIPLYRAAIALVQSCPVCQWGSAPHLDCALETLADAHARLQAEPTQANLAVVVALASLVAEALR